MENYTKINCIRKRQFWIIALFILFGCNSEQNKGLVSNRLITLNINPHKTNTLEEFISKVESVRFLPLESNADNPIDWVRKVWITDKSIFLYTGHTKEVHKYGHDGSFKFKIEKKGKGKEELNWVFDFCPAPNDGLFVLGYLQYYEFDSLGKMTQTHSIDIPYNDFDIFSFFIANDTFSIYSGYSSNQNNKIAKYNICILNNHTSESYFCMQQYTKGMAPKVFQQSNEKVLVNPFFGHDTIYIWDNNHVEPLFCIDFGEYKTPLDKIPVDHHNGQVAISFLKENPGCMFIRYVFMSNDWLTFIFTFNNNEYKVLYHKKKKDMLIGNHRLELFEHILFGSVPLAVFQDEFISAVPAYEIVKKLENNTLDFKFLSEARHQEIIDQLKKVKEKDNPVLMFVKMKPE